MRRHLVAAAAAVVAICGGMLPARAYASTGCDQINAGALNVQVTYTNGSITSSNAKRTAAAVAGTILRTPSQTSDQVFGTSAYYPDATTTFTFAAGDAITLSSSVSGFSVGTDGTSNIQVGLRRGLSSTSSSIAGYASSYSANGTQPNVNLTISNETALGIQVLRGGSTASGTITATVTCMPAASAPTLGSFTYGSIVAYNPGTTTATNLDVATGGNATNSPSSYAVASSSGGTYGGTATTTGGGNVTINNAGVATYTPRAGYRGNDTFYARASNSSGNSGPAMVTVSVGNPTLTATLTGSGARQGVALSGYAVTPAGGAAPYSCTLNSGSAALPAGVTLAANCALSGTPTAAGTYSFAVDVTDSSVTGANGGTAAPWTQSNVAVGGFVVAAPPPTITGIAPAVGPTGQGTAVTIDGTNLTGATAVTFGGVSATQFTVVSATRITATTPSTGTAGAVDVAVTTPGGTATLTGGYRFSAVPSAPVVTAPANGATIGTTTPAYAGVAGANLTITVYVDGASIGTTSADGSGNWSKTQPTALSAASHTIYAQASNTDGLTGPNSATNTFTVTPAPVATGYTAAAVAYNPGGAGAATFSVAGQVSGNPTGYAVGSATTANGGSVAITAAGQVSYTPPVGFRGNDSFTFTASNAGGTSAPATVTVPVANPALTATLIGSGTRGVALAGVSVAASGGTAPYSCAPTLVSGALPAGTSLGANCAITGTPTGSGTFSFAVSLSDSSQPAFTQTSGTLALVVAAPTLTLTPASLPGATAGIAFSQTLSTSGGVAPYSYAVTAGALPGGMTLAGATLSGTPTQAGTYAFTITATDSATAGSGGPYSAARSYTLTVAAPTIAVSPTSVPAGTAGVAYSQTLTASGGTPGYTYAVTAGALPAGLTLGTGGTLSGTPTATGSFAFTVTATDASSGTGAPYSGSRAYTLTIGAPTIVLAPTAIPAGTAGAAYSQSVTASGGTPSYTYVVTAGALPTGMTLNTAGTLSGTPVGSGTYNFTVTATDSTTGSGAPYAGSRAYALTIAAPTIVLTPATIPAGTAGAAYSQSVTASGGTAGYSYAVTAGALPAGVALSAGGTLSGTPVGVGTYNFTITATDSSTGSGAPYAGSRAYTLTIAAPAIALSPTTIPAGTVGVAFSQTLSASGGTPSYSYAVTAGTLPAGVTLSSGGTLSGTPTAAGTYTVTITVTDSTTGPGAPYTASRSYALTIAAPTIALSPTTIPAGTVGTAFSQTLSASGGTPGYSYAVTTGALPAGVTLSTAGTLSGTPTAAGTFTVTVTATDSTTGPGAPYTGSRSYALTIAAPTIVLAPTAIPAGAAGVAYSETLSASGGTPGYSYAVTAGALPAGVTLSTAGTLSGTPTVAGSFTVTITATDSTTGSGAPYSGSRSYTLAIAAPSIAVAPPATPGATVGTAYSLIFSASGGTAPYDFAVTAGALPAGMSLAADGRLSGVPTAGGSFTFTVGATDASAGRFTGTRSYTLNVAAPMIVLTPSSLPAATVGSAYSRSVTASGGTPTYSYAVTAGALPAGITLATDGTLAGTPTAAGSFTATITATDSSGGGTRYSGSRAYTIAVAAPVLALQPTTLPQATARASYAATVSASGGTAPYSYAVTAGALPAGVTLASDGTLSGTPTTPGTYSVTVSATDSSTGTGAPFAATRAYTLSVVAPSLSVATTTLPGAGVGRVYSATIAANGGVAPYRYTVTAGTLPPGVTLAGDGTLAGTPTAGGSFAFTITVADSASQSASQAYTLTVAAATIAIAPTSLPQATPGTAYSQALSATGGTAPYSYALASGSLPAGMTLAANGTIAGTPTAAGSFGFTIAATDASTGSGPYVGTQGYTLVVGASTVTLGTAPLPGGTVGSAYTASLLASGGVGPYRYAVTAGALPAGLALASDGTLSGTPTAGGSFAVTVTATDSSGGSGPFSGSRAYTLVIAAPTIALSPATLPAATTGVAYSQALAGSGGVAPYSYAVTAGALPAGMTVSSTGTVAGTPSASGTFAFTITATDSATGSGPYAGSRAYSLTVAAATIALAPATLPAATAGVTYSQTLSATGGTAPYAYAVSAGTLPPGLTLSSTGTLSGTPTAAGSFTVTIAATDSTTGAGPFVGTRTYTLAVGTAAVVVDTATLPGASVGSAYTTSLSASGGVGPYRYAVTAGALPAGLTLASDSTLSGTPTAGGTFAVTVTATDSSGGSGPASGSRALTLTVAAPTLALTPATLPGGTVGSAYAATLSASGGTPGYSYAVTAGALPAGVTLDAKTGALAGTPTAGGSFTVTITATDASTGSGPYSVGRAYTIAVGAPTIAITPATLPAATVGAAYAQTLSASGGTPGYRFAVTAGALPAGLSLAGDGTLSGTPTAGGRFAVTITATDSSSGGGGAFSAAQAYTLVVNAPTLVLAPATLPGGTVGSAYAASIAASGGVAPYRYAVTAGALPAGVTLDAATGAIAGTPTAGGSFAFTVTATDAATGSGPYTAVQAYRLTIAAAAVTVTTATLPDATVAAAYSQVLAAAGGTAPYTYTVSAGSLPAGLTLSSTGTLAGTPTAGGSFTFTIAATDASTGAGPYVGTRSFTLAVRAAAVAIDTATLPDATVAAAYSQAIAASGGVAPYSYAVTAGALPAGLTLSSAGTLSGTPTAGGRFTFTVTATDSSGGAGPSSATRVYTLVVAAPAIALTPATLPAATTGTAYSQTLGAAGGIAPYAYAITAGALPTGLTLSSTGTIAGTPTVGGSFAFTVTASDASTGSGPYRGAQAYTLVVGAPTIAIDPAPLANATVGARYAATLAASGGVAPYRYAVTAGALPAGLTLASDGTLSGTPTAGGSFAFTVTATDSSGGSGPFSGSRAVTLTVAAPTLALTPTALPDGRMQTGYSTTLTAAGGTAPYSFAVTAGALPGGLTLATNGTLSGTPTTHGSFAFTVTATDASTGSGPYTGAQAYRLVIAAPDAPVAGAVSLSVAYGAAPTTVRPTLSGGTATALAIATPPQHGTAAVDGLTLTYAPAPGYFGPDSFAYTASNDGGTSAPAMVSVTVAKPAPPVAGDRDGVTVAYASPGTAIDLSTSISGVATGVTIASQPAHGTVSASGTTVTYVPAAGYFGTDGFTYAATGPGGASAPAAVRLTVAAPPPPVTKPGASSVAGSTQGGTQVSIDLGALIDGVATGVDIVVQPQHGIVTLGAAAAGSAVALGGRDAGGGVSTAATGERFVATYTPATGFAGTDSFQFVAVGPGGRSAPAVVTITVIGTAPVAQDKTASIGDGQQVSVDLTGGATGGPFTAAQVVGASPAGVAQTAVVATGGGFRLDVTPANRFGGTLTIRYTLTNAFGTSTPASVTVTVAARPDPSLDPTVRGLSDAQAESARRLTQAQIDNFMRRAETLHGAGGSAGVSMGARLNALNLGGGGAAAADQSFGARMLHPGATSPRDDLDRRSELAATLAGNAPGARTIGRHAAGAEASPDQAAQADADTPAGGRRVGSAGIWSGGSVDIGTLDARGGRSKITAGTAGLSAGVDVRVAPGVTIGVGGGYGNEASQIGGDAARLRTHGTMAAAYASITPVDGTFVDGMIGRGDLDMRLRRLVAQTGGVAVGDREADLVFGALAAGIDRTAATLRWSAYGRFEYMQADLDAYRETGADRYDLRFDARSLRSIGGVLGGRIEGLYRTSFGAMMPRLRVEWRHEFANADPQLLDYADIAGPAFYRVDTIGWNRDQVQVAVGTRVGLPADWLLDLDLGVSAGQGQRSGTVRVGIGKGF